MLIKNMKQDNLSITDNFNKLLTLDLKILAISVYNVCVEFNGHFDIIYFNESRTKYIPPSTNLQNLNFVRINTYTGEIVKIF